MVERLFREITTGRLRRGAFASAPALIGAINEYIAHHNTQPKGTSKNLLRGPIAAKRGSLTRLSA